jgi:hypothetical protein
LAAPAWTYSDWVTYEPGSASRLTQLRLHIKEVSDALSTGNYSNPKGAHDKSYLQDYVADLLRKEASEAAVVGISTDIRTSWTRGRCV